MLTYFILSVVVLVIVGVILVARRPVGFRVARSVTVSAPPAAAFARVNDLREYLVWSPWSKEDPAAKNVIEGLAAGPGAVLAWTGPKVGAGRMILTESRPDELVRFRLEFQKPFRATNVAEFTFQPEGEDRTVVTWSMTGTNNFLFKAVGLFMDCDKMIGSKFEDGLAKLKRQSETAATGRLVGV